MKKFFIVLALFASLGMASGASAVTLDVIPSSAPNYYGSSSWAGYQTNAMNALQNGLPAIGDRDTDPTAYLAFADGAIIDAGNAMVTSFKSWIGVADPAAPFASENGNRMHFGLHAYGDGNTQFTLSDVSFNLTSSDPGNYLGFSGDLVGTTFNGTSRIGIDWGADDAPGGGDDTIYNSGEVDGTLVDELIYVGVGNAFWPGGDDVDKVNPDAGRQGSIDNTYGIYPVTDLAMTYTILGSTGTASVTLVPEPSSMILAGLAGLFGLVAYRRRKA